MKIKLTNKVLIPVAIAIVLVLAAGIAMWAMLTPKGDVVAIHKDGSVIKEIDLADVKKPYTVNLGTNVVYVEKDGVSMQSAKCPDKICVHQGKITKNGEAIICAPNKIMLEFRAKDSGVDAVAGAR